MTWGARRTYKQAKAEASRDGYSVSLDDKPLRTPAGALLEAPTQALAEAIVAEWQEQGDKVDPRTMPLTRLLSTALDRIPPEREAVVRSISAYAGTDLLCYRADSPADLVTRQQAVWQELLDWAAGEVGAALTVTSGITPVAQPQSALDSYRKAVGQLSPLELSALGSVTPVAGSLVIGLALLSGRLDAQGAFDAAELDATFQIERWGEDAEAMERRQRLLRDFQDVERFVRLLKTN
jgi:chaperone required for assembly of F1-ATPase